MTTTITVNINIPQGQGYPAQAVAATPIYPNYVPYSSAQRSLLPGKSFFVAGFTILLIGGGLYFLSSPLKAIARIARMIPISYQPSSRQYAKQSSLPDSEYPSEQVQEFVEVAPQESTSESVPQVASRESTSESIPQVAPKETMTPQKILPPTLPTPVPVPKKIGGAGKLKFSGKWEQPATKGERIANYRISSIFGPRVAPVPGASTFHKGTDVGVPTGTPLYAIASPDETISVRCWVDPSGGGGNVATFKGAGEEFQYLHLSRCKPGTAKLGDVIAWSGATGRGSGPHLHIERRKSPGAKEKVPIERGFVFWSLIGKPPQ